MTPMKNIFKRFEVLAINSKANSFKGAVIRLTAFYALGIFSILCVFTFLVYGLFLADIQATLKRDHHIETMEGEEPLVVELTEHLLDVLLIIDAVLFLVTIVVSYVLAKHTLAPLAIAYQKQKRFVADAAHELRTPLAVLKAGYEVTLQKERTVPEYQKHMHEALDEVDRLITMSNDLLFLAQGGNSAQIPTERISLSEVCASQSELIVSYAAHKKIKIIQEIAEDVHVRGNRNDLTRLVLNVLKNAVDYNKEEGSVTMRLAVRAGYAVVKVEDTGVGIKKADIPFIFERFFKADTARTAQHNTGTGLGLAIVKEIAERHGGYVRASSDVGVGTTIEIALPCV
jgi:signal transduction histidine kinase